MTPTQWQQRALNEVGSIAINAVFQLDMPLSTDGGTLVISYQGDTTDAIDYNDSAADHQAAFEAMGSVETGNIRVTGQKKGPYFYEFIGELGGQEITAPTANGADLEPPSALAFTLLRQGMSTDFSSSVAGIWDEHDGVASEKLQFLYTKLDLIDWQLGIYRDMVDNQIATLNAVNTRDNQRFDNMLKMRGITQQQIDEEVAAAGSGSTNQTQYTRIARRTANEQSFGVLRRNATTGWLE